MEYFSLLQLTNQRQEIRRQTKLKELAKHTNLRIEVAAQLKNGGKKKKKKKEKTD